MIRPTDANAILSMAKFIKELTDIGYAISFEYKDESIYLKMYNNSTKLIYSLSIETIDGTKILYDKFLPIKETLYEKILMAEHDMYGTLMITTNSYKYLGSFSNNDYLTMIFIIDNHDYNVNIPIKEIVDTELSKGYQL